ncbi:MAG: hypothetical protein KBD27_00915 [Candidatus Moranbacteria bacterium]|nr:hypothetical protein [Candidatus Moranbacteria bacterium]
MTRLFGKKLKIVFSLFLIVHLFVATAAPAAAGLFSGPKIPSATSIMTSAEKRYHIDTEAMQNMGESLNTSETKNPTPAVSLSFSPSDPRVGEKVSAKAFPMYFSSTEKDLYYTWYLKRKECSLQSPPLSASVRALCDRDFDDRVTVEDWKIEAAQLIAQSGFSAVEAEENYTSDTDDDGYKAPMGGGNKKAVANHCYYNNPATGKNYELGTSGDIEYDCPAGMTPTCLAGEGSVEALDIAIPGSDPFAPVAGTSGPAFEFNDTGVCDVAGTPMCSGAGVAYCNAGSPRCVADIHANPLTCDDAVTPVLSTCSGGGGGFNASCNHLFPRLPSSGDGTFGLAEEKFWGTSPKDASTADNGNKDEANVIGLGQNVFEWNYSAGDQVGVVVEGTSMIGTKYDDSSSMIMWAFSKGDCPISEASSTGSFYKQIKGYQVDILSIDIDLNKCLERNLVDPTQGGQATKLDVSVSATPESPINDSSFVLDPPVGGVPVPEGGGDTVIAEASIGNSSRGVSEVLFEWDIELANNPQFKNGAGLLSNKVMKELQDLRLLGSTKGTALDSIQLKLDILDNNTTLFSGHRLADYLDATGSGYLRFTAKVSENFASGAVRKGRSDVVVKFVSTGKKIAVYKPLTKLVGSAMQVTLPNIVATNPICNDDPLDRISCRIIKNEAIGLRIDPTDLTNFQWAINGTPLLCNRAVVSEDCEKDATGVLTVGKQNFVNFFPVTGEVGDTYTVTVSANDVKTGKIVNLSRSFHVISPQLSIESADLNAAWPKLIGQYKDVDGAASTACPSGACNEYSDSVLEGFATENLKFQSDFIPDFLASRAERQWTVDGVSIEDTATLDVDGNTVYTINFDALKNSADVYNIALVASVTQPQDIRRALRDIWGVSPLESTELRFSAGVQVQLKEPGFAQGTLQGTKKYLAALSSYVPASLMFLLRIVLSVMLILLTTRFLLALLPEYPNFSTVPRRRS